MLPDPRRAEEDFQAETARLRTVLRTRLGILAGLVIAGLVQTDYNVPAGAGLVAIVVQVVNDAMVVLGIAAAGLVLIFGLLQRDQKRAHDLYESKRFRVPTRKTRS